MSNKIISDYIQLQSDFHRTYFALQEKNSENDRLKKQIEELESDYFDLQKEHEHLKRMQQESMEAESVLKRENKGLLAKIKQLQRDSLPKTAMLPTTPHSSKLNKTLATPSESKKTPKSVKKTRKKMELDYEVDSLIKHRTWRGKLQFLVRWKNYSKEDDRWIDEKNLNCPSILKEYRKKHKM